jgi:hypothetical protein
VREMRFSNREIVGCDAKGAPVSGKRSRISLQMGSSRSVVESTYVALAAIHQALPAIGAGVVVFLRNIVSAYTERWLLVLGLIYVLVVLCAPHGIVGVLRDRLPSRLSRRAAP